MTLSVYDRAREIRVLYLDRIGVDKIYDELCTCGCYRSQHGELGHYPWYNNITEIGMGQCLYCSCKKFIWKGFLVLEEPGVPVVTEVEMFLAQAQNIKEGKEAAMPEKVR